MAKAKAKILVVGSMMLLGWTGLSCGDGADTASGFAKEFCALLQPCCAMANLRTDGQQCAFLFGGLGGQASYNKQAGQTCLAETRAASARGDFCQTLDSNGSAACDQVFSEPGGSKKPGETCEDTSDCAPSSEGEVECQLRFGAGGAQTSKCQVQIKGKDGDKPCVGTKDGNVTSGNTGLDDIPPRGYICDLADGLRCDSTTDSCVKLKMAGEACTGNSTDCVRTTYCDSVRRLCTERKAVGVACTPSFFSTECADAAYCNDTTRMCAAQAADGAACTKDDQCRSGDCTNDKCVKATGTDIGLAFICGAK